MKKNFEEVFALTQAKREGSYRFDAYSHKLSFPSRYIESVFSFLFFSYECSVLVPAGDRLFYPHLSGIMALGQIIRSSRYT